MMKSDRFRSASKLVLGIGLVVCALACAIYGVLMIPVVKGVEFQWEYFALIGFVAVLVLLVSVIFLGISKSAEQDEIEDSGADEDALAKASVEVTFTKPCNPAKPITRAQRAVIESIDCTARAGEHKLSVGKLADKDTLKKIAKIAIPTLVVGVFVWSVSANIKHAKAAKRRRQFYRWLG